MDDYALDKMKRLLGDKFNAKKGIITLSADRYVYWICFICLIQAILLMNDILILYNIIIYKASNAYLHETVQVICSYYEPGK